MLLGDLLQEIEERGVSLKCGLTEDRLFVSPPDALTPELKDGLKERKADVLRVLREDEAFEHTGIIQHERQVLDLAREYFGNGEV